MTAAKCMSIVALTTLTEFVVIIASRGNRVNIFEQPPRFNRGAGDISNLWNVLDKESLVRGGEMRNALKPNSPNRWTRYINSQGQYVIPYIYGGKFDDSEHSTIARAMLAISQNTCIKFQKRAGEADYVELKNERGEGCYTTVGRTKGKNIVMLETNTISTCIEFDIVIHELMHAIGLWHEQMRYDRDDYIKIHYENIAPAYYTQFEKIPETDSTIYGVKYDYESVMHYAKDAFASAPGKITMETLNKDFQDVIGKMKDASPGDYLKICNIYSCRVCMGRPFTPLPQKHSANETSNSERTTGREKSPEEISKTNNNNNTIRKADENFSANKFMLPSTMTILSSSSAALATSYSPASPFALSSPLREMLEILPSLVPKEKKRNKRKQL